MMWAKGTESLTHARTLLHVSGPSSIKYLNNLITSNLPAIASSAPPSLHDTLLLDSRGRVITDAFLWKLASPATTPPTPPEFVLDIPSPSAATTLTHLDKYKLRRTKVTITDITAKSSVTAIYGTTPQSEEEASSFPNLVACTDPRSPHLGLRVLTSADTPISSFINTTDFPSTPDTYDVLRRLSNLPEGLEVENALPLEINAEFRENTISFDKGCYLGQELTARTFHTGKIRKRAFPALLLSTTEDIPDAWLTASSKGILPKLPPPIVGTYERAKRAMLANKGVAHTSVSARSIARLTHPPPLARFV